MIFGIDFMVLLAENGDFLERSDQLSLKKVSDQTKRNKRSRKVYSLRNALFTFPPSPAPGHQVFYSIELSQNKIQYLYYWRAIKKASV